MTNLARWLSDELALRGISPADFARMTRYSEAHVSRLLSGERQGRSLAAQTRIADALGFSRREMLDAIDADEHPPPNGEHRRDLTEAIMADPLLKPEEREALAALYEAIVRPRRRR